MTPQTLYSKRAFCPKCGHISPSVKCLSCGNDLAVNYPKVGEVWEYELSITGIPNDEGEFPPYPRRLTGVIEMVTDQSVAFQTETGAIIAVPRHQLTERFENEKTD